MIEKATSIQFKGKVNTFNRPIISLCRTTNGLETYFLKYLRNSSDIDGLFSEIICSRLARKLYLNTPDIALVEIGNHPIDPDRIKFHYKLEPGLIVFGSKSLKRSGELSQHNFVLSKHDFNRLKYPPHILRIAMFDLWVGNRDRRGDNFNLFLTQSRKQKLYVFDHFEVFAKIVESSRYNVPYEIDAYQGLLGTAYGYEMLQWAEMIDLKHEMNKFLNLMEAFDAGAFLTTVMTELPSAWSVDDKTISYVNVS